MPQAHVVRLYTREQVEQIMSEASEIAASLDVAPDLLPLAFTKAAELLAASHALVQADPQFSLPPLSPPNGRR